MNTGPEGAYLSGDYNVIAIHPRSPQIVYASTYYGLFRSSDGGSTWQRRPAPPSLFQVALDPVDPQTLYALASGGLYRTTDAGASWVKLRASVRGFTPETGLLTVSPSSPQRMYLLLYGACGRRVFSSADAGRTWVQAGCIEAAGRYQPVAILVDPRSPRTVYVWVWLKGIFRSDDGGATWTHASAGLPIGKLSSVAAHPKRSGVLYAGSERGDVFRTLDAGSTWRAVARGLDGGVTDLAVSAADGAVYAGTSARDRADGIDVGGGVVYRSAIGRAPWSARSDGLTGWNVRALAAHPSRPGTVLAGTEHGIFGTRNGGVSWGERVTGLVASSPTGVAVDPANAQSVFATVERGVGVSRDGGHTWGAALDLRRERADVELPLAVPGAPATLYAVKRSHAAPKPASILLASRDAGRTWLKVGALPHSGESVSALVADPTDATTLYLVSRGIFKSVDAGRTWERIYSAVDKRPADALAVDPFDSKVLYALVRGRLRKSENGGRTWQQLPGIPRADIWQFALDPHRRGTVYAVTGGYGSAVYASKDRGGTWSMLGKPLGAMTLLVDPVRPGVVYAGTTNGVYVKRPGATTWQAVGPAGRHVGWLATDAKGRRLYAGIEGGGVAATRLPLPPAGIRRSAVSMHSSAKAGARSASRAAGLIAFTREEHGVYVMRSDGSGARRIWYAPTPVTGLGWSPNGEKLAVGTLGYGREGGLYVMNADGSSSVRIADISPAAVPSWSPDGHRLAVAVYAYNGQNIANRRDIWIVNEDGSVVRRLAPLRFGVFDVDWSPTGSRLVFTSAGFWGGDVYVMNTNGRSLRRLAGAMGESPDWSPDGRRIVFQRYDRGGGIWVMDGRGRSRARLASNGSHDPVWSPGGGRIAFVRGDASKGSSEIYVMNADGSGTRRLTNNRLGEGSPAWQPVARRAPQPTSRR